MDNQNEDTNADTNTDQVTQLDEREVLKSRARMLGLEFGNNTSTETLKKKIADKLAGVEETVAKEVNPLGESEVDDNSPMAIRQRLHAEQMKLVRCRITCMDPKKKDLPGEIFTVANEYLGTVSKFIPFGEATDDGYHIPFCLYTMLNDRKFLNIRTRKDRKSGQTVVEHGWAKEFSIEILPQLTEAELARLATAQVAAGSMDSPNGFTAA